MWGERNDPTETLRAGNVSEGKLHESQASRGLPPNARLVVG